MKEKKNGITCVGVVEITICSQKNPTNCWTMRLGFASTAHTEEAGIDLQKRAVMLTKQAVEKQPEKYGFAKGEEIAFGTSINVLACEEIIGMSNGN